MKAVAARVADVASTVTGGAKQTVEVVGQPPETLVAYNKDAAPAPHFELPVPPKGADPAEVARIASEIALPPLKKDSGDADLALFPFPADALADYKEDVSLVEVLQPENREKYLFRVTVHEALETIRMVWRGEGEGSELREEFVGETSDAVKKQILDEQLFPAAAIPRLERAITLLEAVEPLKEAAPKRWQANYEYAVGQCKARLAFMHEYNLALGSIRTDVLPPLDPAKGEDGYKLISAERMKARGEREIAEAAYEHFDVLTEDYKGTPWAVQAKRDKLLSLGLSWQPFNSKAGEPTAE